MAVLAVNNMVEVHDGKKTIHPFFDKSSRSKQGSLNSNGVSHLPSNLEPDTDKSLLPISVLAGHQESISYDTVASDNATTNTQSVHAVQPPQLMEALDVDLNQDRRKRQRISSPSNKITTYVSRTNLSGDAVETGTKDRRSETDRTAFPKIDSLEALGQDNASEPPDLPSSTSVSLNITTLKEPAMDMVLEDDIPASPLDQSKSAVDGQLDGHTDRASPAKPKKMLLLNSKTGTIGSPPMKKSRSTDEPPNKSSRSKRSTEPRSLVVKLNYGSKTNIRESIGSRIEQILASSKTSQAETKTSSAGQVACKVTPPKSTHPFFLGKAAQKQDRSQISRTEDSKSPEKKPLNVRPSFFPMMGRTAPSMNMSSSASHGVNPSQFGNASKIMKFPGAMEPIWPPSGMIHVRGEVSFSSSFSPSKITRQPERKAKYAATEPHVEEDILHLMASEIDIYGVTSRLNSLSTEDFPEPDKCLRIPGKHFEAGFALRRRVQPELSARIPSILDSGDISSEDELNKAGTPKSNVHPALSRVYNMLPTSLSAFDRSQYETKSWIHKYAPTAAGEVLQRGREANILRDWLKGLIVMSVDTGADEDPKRRDGSVTGRRSTATEKRKRKAKKLDGFIVSSDEEADDMDEITEPELDESPASSQGLQKRTVVRGGDLTNPKGSGKIMNAVVISGPSGCGKTATVYAVAKELGFEVFEINSSSRRSGKDVLERVGDMTRNHLVHQSKQELVLSSQEEAMLRASEALNEDLKSGRQGTMNSFFKPVSSKIKGSARGRKPRETKTEVEKAIQKIPKKAKQQKQSLILLEEVDVLYDEDKQFWATVMTLIVQSKRPVIMTCNDETLIPLQAISLHAIIRLVPPPLDMAVDYMLLVAANEGHALKRTAVKSLYEASSYDLRASLTELEFWCQIGIGDRRGGFEWFYPRWPRGIDKDPDGNTIRVVSEGTYHQGMGWLSQDHICDNLEGHARNEEMLLEAWNGWQVDAADWHEVLNLPSWAKGSRQNIITGTDAQQMLSDYETFVDAMSAADVCSWGGFASINQIPLDTTTPSMTAKMRDDFTMGYELLESSTPASYNGLATAMSISIKCEALRNLQLASSRLLHKDQTQLSLPTEARIISTITRFRTSHDDSITRHDYSLAFDPIATSERTFLHAPTYLEQSCFDQPMSQITTDIAPYIRSIVTYDAKLQQERARLSNLLSEGGRYGKRQRTTRSALSALEGGKRNTTRRERWFNDKLNSQLVLRTGCQAWQDVLSEEMVSRKAELEKEREVQEISMAKDDESE